MRLTCTICGEKAKLPCPCGTTQYCSTDCQRIDWRDRGHRKACKKIRAERAAEAARAEAPTPPPEVVYGPAPRSHADEVRARIAAEHEAARKRREANPEPEPQSVRFGSRCPICLEEWDVNANPRLLACCCRNICESCDKKALKRIEAGCPLCQVKLPVTNAEELARLRRHVENEVPEAIQALGSAYSTGALGLVKSAKKAAKIWKRAVELGNVNSMVNLGLLFTDGIPGGVKQDMKKAEQLFRMAAGRGSAAAHYNVAVLRARRNELDEETFRYCLFAAEQGYKLAEYWIGSMFAHRSRGELPERISRALSCATALPNNANVEADAEEAVRWWKRAAAKGHEAAATGVVRTVEWIAELRRNRPEPLTFKEKETLANDINSLPPEDFDGVVDIVAAEMALTGGDEIEVDIETLDTDTLRRMQNYVTQVGLREVRAALGRPPKT